MHLVLKSGDGPDLLNSKQEIKIATCSKINQPQKDGENIL